MNIYNFSHKGIEQDLNRDCCVSFVKGECIGIGLSDGAGSKNKSHIGAREIMAKVLQYVVTNIAVLLEEEKSIKYNVFREIEFSLDELAREQTSDRGEYGATFLMVCIYKNRYLAVHIGDGLIGYTTEKNVQILSHPCNGICRQYTYLTTSKNLYKYMNVYSGNIDKIQQFFLISDGVTEKMYDRVNMNDFFQKSILNRDYQEIEDYLNSSPCRDDYSLICVSI